MAWIGDARYETVGRAEGCVIRRLPGGRRQALGVRGRPGFAAGRATGGVLYRVQWLDVVSLLDVHAAGAVVFTAPDPPRAAGNCLHLTCALAGGGPRQWRCSARGAPGPGRPRPVAERRTGGLGSRPVPVSVVRPDAAAGIAQKTGATMLRKLGLRARMGVAGVVGLALLVPGPAAAAAPAGSGWSSADYWAFADRLMGALDVRWDAARDVYAAPGGAGDVRENSAMLLVHAVAAYERHMGPTRRDARAAAIADRLTRRPAWLGTARAPHAASTCWSTSLDAAVRGHMSLESKVAEALAWAWRARRPLALPPATVRRIVERLDRCAHSSAWRYPSLVQNQMNWYAEMDASAALVTGRPGLLRHDYRRQLARFAAGIEVPMPGERTPNLGTGYEFHYAPGAGATRPINLDTPEYANIVVHALGTYDRALRAGMRPLPAAAMRRLRAWVLRLLAGSWTHAGYLNWDTGKGFARWHSAQYWAFAQQGLLAIAASPRFWSRPDEGAWAKALFDRGLVLYRRLADENGSTLAPPEMFGVRSRMEFYDCFCARMLANSVRAVALGLGARPVADPPPLYAFDPDTGRLAITTPRYSTAIVPDNRGAFAYGGIDPARLFSAGQRVAAGVGGTPPAAFGVVIADAHGHELLASQHARVRSSPALRIVRSPRGPLLHPRAYPRRPYAGPFAVVEARGTVRRGPLRVAADHRFTRDAVVSRWRASCRGPCAAYRVRAHFPTWGAGAVIEAVRRDGTRIRLAGPGAQPEVRVALADVARLRLLGDGGGGYTVAVLRAPAGAVAFALAARSEPTNPRPGPSLAVELQAAGHLDSRALSVRIRPLA